MRTIGSRDTAAARRRDLGGSSLVRSRWSTLAVFVTLIALSIPQFDCNPPDCPSITLTNAAGGTTTILQKDYVQQFLGTGFDHWYAYYLAYLVLTIVILRAIIALSIAKVSHLKR